MIPFLIVCKCLFKIVLLRKDLDEDTLVRLIIVPVYSQIL